MYRSETRPSSFRSLERERISACKMSSPENERPSRGGTHVVKGGAGSGPRIVEPPSMCTLMNEILQLKDISKTFPGVKALQGITFDLREGEVHCLCGENGAGKSTLIKILSGAYQPDDGGEIVFEGRSVDAHPALSPWPWASRRSTRNTSSSTTSASSRTSSRVPRSPRGGI